MVGIVGSNWIAGRSSLRYGNNVALQTLLTLRLGGIASLSHFAMPGLLSAPVSGRLLAQQWQTMYSMGKATMPSIALVSLAAYGYAAYGRSRRHLDWKRYAVAGALTLGIVPFTLGFMQPTNRSLMQIASGGATAAMVNDDSVRALITTWAGLNLIRSLLPLCGAVVGLWALMQEKAGLATAGAKQPHAAEKDVAKSHPAAASKATGGDDVSQSHPAAL